MGTRPEVTRVGDFTLTWGESLRWDEQRQRLYFVDCAAKTLHWLEGAEPPLHTFELPTVPTGLALIDDGHLIAALDDGLHLVDADARTHELLTPYPEGLKGRANDAAADLDGNLVTGTLTLEPNAGAFFWFSAADGWRLLDDGLGDNNGPVVLSNGDRQTLVMADTVAGEIYAYDYDGAAGRAENRRVLGDAKQFDAMPDGACADDQNGVWSCMLGPGVIARYTEEGFAESLDTGGVEQPSDVCFAGPDLDRMFFVSIALDLGGVKVTSPNAGALMVIDGSGFQGRVEPRFDLRA